MSRGHSVFVRRVLAADAAISGATGVLMFAASSVIDAWLGVPSTLLRYAGLTLLPFAIVVAYLARREDLSAAAVWAVIAANTLWALDSVALLYTGWIEPTALGYAFIVFQAVVVALLAELQYVGVRRLSAAAA